ncbi:MAG: HupE/UreJ family protein [Gammaproteobacteria bacterium]
MTRLICALTCFFAAASAFAHDPSRSLLTLAVDGAALHGRLDVSLRDLEDAVGLDADGDAAITWGEVAARSKDIERYAQARLSVQADGVVCRLEPAQRSVDQHGGAAFAVIDLEGACASVPRVVRVTYGLLFDVDPAHRAILELGSGGASTTAVLSAERPTFEAEVATLSPWTSFVRFVTEGVWHIWHGYDHLAFVTLLVLPIVLGATERRSRKRKSAREAIVSIAGVITAFTAAHSLTLALATLGVINVPARAVESAIALSVLVAALLNVLPSVPRLGAKLAFGFGLVHGLGFATALGDLGTSGAGVAVSLAGFNVGVELGQIAVVTAVLPLLFTVRSHGFGRAAVNYACSAACGALAVVWLAQRIIV